MEDHTRAKATNRYRDDDILLPNIAASPEDAAAPERYKRNSNWRAATVRGEGKLINRSNKKVRELVVAFFDKDILTVIWQTVFLTLAAIAMYAFQLWLWWYVYKTSFGLVIVISGACALCSLALMALPEMKTVVFVFGVFCFQAVVVGTLIGFICYYKDLVYSDAYAGLHTYTNVNAAVLPARYADAGAILFTKSTFLDISHSAGFKHKWDGHMYCVAPVVDSTMTNTDVIRYYAVGVNCCTPRGEFTCGDASNANANAAVALLDDDLLGSKPMPWLIGHDPSVYLSAVQMHQSYFTMPTANDVKFVSWSLDPMALIDGFTSDAAKIVWYFSIPYACLVALAACISSWLLKPKRNLLHMSLRR